MIENGSVIDEFLLCWLISRGTWLFSNPAPCKVDNAFSTFSLNKC